MPFPEGIRVTPLESSVSAMFQVEPPGWTRLEPQSVSGDPTPGVEARVHDPLWLLARQWQLGEFHGEDAGTPIAVHIARTVRRIGTWQAGAPPPLPPVHAWRRTTLLEEAVEREPTPEAALGLRQRAEAGAQFLTMLGDAGITGLRDTIVAECPLAVTTPDPFDTRAAGLLRLLGGRLPDAEEIADRLAPGLATEPPTLPDWFDGLADPGPALGVAREWLGWYRGQVAPLPDPSTDCWIEDQLEYHFSLGLGDAEDQVVLRAPAFGGGRIDWYAFDHDPNGALPPPDGAAQPLPPESLEQTVWATPLTFTGMPVDRYWQFEEGQVNLGRVEAQPHDLARLLLVEFAIVYGNDWLVVPVDVPFGSLVTLDRVRYTTTFGETFDVPAADDRDLAGNFRLFGLSRRGSDETLPGLFVPPAAVGAIDGRPLEEVLFLRDEMANMAWAVERMVQGPSGDPRSRGDEPRPEAPTPGTESAELDYLLQTDVPANWLPLVPVSTGYRTIALRKGAMVRGGTEVLPMGVLIEPTPFTIRDEEIPREGVRVRRLPVLARRVDGSYARWVARRASVGRGEGASGLAFDSAIPRRRPGT